MLEQPGQSKLRPSGLNCVIKVGDGEHVNDLQPAGKFVEAGTPR
jgi:hypothetical protein